MSAHIIDGNVPIKVRHLHELTKAYSKVLVSDKAPVLRLRHAKPEQLIAVLAYLNRGLGKGFEARPLVLGTDTFFLPSYLELEEVNTDAN